MYRRYSHRVLGYIPTLPIRPRHRRPFLPHEHDLTDR